MTGGVLPALGVEHAQRVAGQRLRGSARRARRRRPRSARAARRRSGAVGGLAERVEQQRHLAQPEALEEAPAEGDHLDVEVRVVGAEHLDADLVELAVAAALRLLVAEVRPGVPHLPRRRRTVLDERPAHAGGLLGPQGDVAAALVGEVVHLLGDDVGGLADALEHADVLHHRRDDLAVAGGLDDLGEDLDEAPEARRFRREDVAHPGAGLERRHDDQAIE